MCHKHQRAHNSLAREVKLKAKPEEIWQSGPIKVYAQNRKLFSQTATTPNSACTKNPIHLAELGNSIHTAQVEFLSASRILRNLFEVMCLGKSTLLCAAAF